MYNMPIRTRQAFNHPMQRNFYAPINNINKQEDYDNRAKEKNQKNIRNCFIAVLLLGLTAALALTAKKNGVGNARIGDVFQKTDKKAVKAAAKAAKAAAKAEKKNLNALAAQRKAAIKTMEGQKNTGIQAMVKANKTSFFKKPPIDSILKN